MRSVSVVAFAAGTVLLVVGAAWTLTDGAWDGDPRDVRGFLGWALSALTEPPFSVVGGAGAGLVIGGWFAHLAHVDGRRWQGFLQACGTGVWPAVVAASALSLVLSALLWGWTLADGVWQPLFVPIASVAPAVVVLYGPRWRVVATASVLGAVLTPPAALAAVDLVCRPLSLPPVIGVTGGMAAGAAVAFLVCRLLPWLPPPWAWQAGSAPAAAPSSPPPRGAFWLLRRALADYSEAQFFGNEWASLAMLAGSAAVFALAPDSLSYGSGLFPAILGAQVLTSLIAVAVWRRRWRTGFFPTFVPVVSTAPAAVLAYGGDVVPVLVVVVAGALIAPPLAAGISARLPRDFHPFIGNVASMALSTLLLVPLVGLIQNGAS